MVMRPSRAHVLLLDDDEGILRLARKTLERAGYRVTAVGGVSGARQCVDSDRPDLLILDYQLDTRETGLDFFRWLVERHLAMPAILVTGFTDESRVIEALRSGVADVVPKSGDYLEYLPEAVDRALAQVRLRQQLVDAERMRDAGKHYRAIAEAVPHLVWTWTAAGECDFVSSQWTGYTGLPPERLLGRQWFALVHPDDVVQVGREWDAATRRNAGFDMEYRLRRHDGVYRWFRTRGAPVPDSAGVVRQWFGTSTDVDNERLALEERERLLRAEQSARQSAEDANRAKDRFLAMLSHELRTPLTPVLASARMLESLADLPASVRHDIRVIRRNIELEARLIDDLLDVTKVANGKMHLQLEAVDTHELIQAVLDIFRSDVQVREQQIRLDFAARRAHVHADRARMQQMLWNLIKNSAKFTPRGGSITVSTANDDAGNVLVSVADTGIGIEPERLGRLFTAFEQGDAATTRQYGGLGLGLAITRSLAEAHAGTVTATSAGRGKGATFTLRLPAVEPPATPPAEEGAPAAHSVLPLTILLIEDHADTAEVMARLLESLGHTVHARGSVADALAAVDQARHDLIVSDIGLPDGTGLDFIRAYRKQRDTPAIALTGFGMEEDVRRCLEAGFNAHLTKPVNFGQLEMMIERVALDKYAAAHR
jgi:PAS domain S-box-containing protein